MTRRRGGYCAVLCTFAFCLGSFCVCKAKTLLIEGRFAVGGVLNIVHSYEYVLIN